jgi:hypothetical protein
MCRRFRVAVATVIALGVALPAWAERQADPDGEEAIRLTGVVRANAGERLILEHGRGEITVALDGNSDATVLDPGRRITVFGRIDAEAFERRTIEADAIYAFGRGLVYRAGDFDAKDPLFASPVGSLPEGSWVELSGTVGTIGGTGFALQSGGPRPVRVITDRMPSDPLDDLGEPALEAGDRVLVSGRVDDADFFESAEIHAETIRRIEDASGS